MVLSQYNRFVKAKMPAALRAARRVAGKSPEATQIAMKAIGKMWSGGAMIGGRSRRRTVRRRSTVRGRAFVGGRRRRTSRGRGFGSFLKKNSGTIRSAARLGAMASGNPTLAMML